MFKLISFFKIYIQHIFQKIDIIISIIIIYNLDNDGAYY